MDSDKYFLVPGIYWHISVCPLVDSGGGQEILAIVP